MRKGWAKLKPVISSRGMIAMSKSSLRLSIIAMGNASGLGCAAVN